MVDHTDCFEYEVKEEGAIPFIIYLKDSLALTHLKLENSIDNYPEISLLLEYNIVPLKLIIGNPNALMTFNFEKTLEQSDLFSKQEYETFLKALNSKRKRKKFWKKLESRIQT